MLLCHFSWFFQNIYLFIQAEHESDFWHKKAEIKVPCGGLPQN